MIFLTVLATQHDDHAAHGLALSIMQNSAVSQQRARGDGSDLFEQDGNPVGRAYDNVSEISDACSASDAANGVLLLGVFDIAAAEVGVVVRDGDDDIVQSKVVTSERLRIDFDGVLLGLASPGVDLADARHGEQRVPHGPVMKGLLVHQRHSRRLHGVLIHLSEGGRHRVHKRLQAAGNASLHLIEAFGHQLPDQVLVHRVIEDDCDHRQVEFGGGTYQLQLRHAHHGRLNGKGDELLDLNRGHAGALHCNDHLVVGQIGKGFERKILHDGNAAYQKHEQESKNKPPIPQQEVDQSLHDQSSPTVPFSNSPFTMKAPSTTTWSVA